MKKPNKLEVVAIRHRPTPQNEMSKRIVNKWGLTPAMAIRIAELQGREVML